MALPTRPLLLGIFGDGTGYAYNLAHPSGVKYLTRDTFLALKKLVHETGNPPTLPERPTALHSAIATAGLVAETSAPSYRKGSPPRTMTVWFHIANACNLSCAYCYIPNLVKAADEETRAKYLMASADVDIAVEQMFDACAQQGFRGLQIKFAGGEPTLNADAIERACALARRRSEETGIAISFRILTNGVFDSGRMIPIFQANAFGVSISVDGEPEGHDRIRFITRRPTTLEGTERGRGIERIGTWEFIRENITALHEVGLKPYLLCTVTENNLRSLGELVTFCRDRQIGFRLSPVRDRATYARLGRQAEFASVLTELYAEIGATYPGTMPIERFARFAEWNLATPKEIACGSCRSMVAVDERGNVSSCQMRLNAPVDSIRSSSLSTLFDRIREAPEYEYMVAPERKTGGCVRCDYRYVCAGGCPEHTRAVTGTTNAPSPWCDLYTMFLPQYVRAVATQVKRAVDTRLVATVALP